MTSRAVAGPREEAIQALIDRFTNSGPVTDRNPHGTIYEGSATSPSVSHSDEGVTRVKDAMKGLGFAELEAADEYPYRAVWQSNERMMTVTHCEGDVSIFVSPNLTAWRNAKAAFDVFYGIVRASTPIRYGQVSLTASRYGAHPGSHVELRFGPQDIDGERWYEGKLPNGDHVFIRDAHEGARPTDSQDGRIRIANGDIANLAHPEAPNETQVREIRRRLKDETTVTIWMRPFDLPPDYVLCRFSDGFECGISPQGEVSS